MTNIPLHHHMLIWRKRNGSLRIRFFLPVKGRTVKIANLLKEMQPIFFVICVTKILWPLFWPELVFRVNTNSNCAWLRGTTSSFKWFYRTNNILINNKINCRTWFHSFLEEIFRNFPKCFGINLSHLVKQNHSIENPGTFSTSLYIWI